VNISATFNRTSSNSRVYAYPRTEGCTDPTRYDMGRVVSGRAERPGLPFGAYDLCVQFLRDSNSTWYRLETTTDVQNRNAGGTATQTFAVNSGSSPTGACPA
jgi:hypothetical protein